MSNEQLAVDDHPDDQAAIDQGCRQAVLDTFSFQAPAFYQRHGYEIAGVFDNFPEGHQKYFLRKELRGRFTTPDRDEFLASWLGTMRL